MSISWTPSSTQHPRFRHLDLRAVAAGREPHRSAYEHIRHAGQLRAEKRHPAGQDVDRDEVVFPGSLDHLADLGLPVRGLDGADVDETGKVAGAELHGRLFLLGGRSVVWTQYSYRSAMMRRMATSTALPPLCVMRRTTRNGEPRATPQLLRFRRAGLPGRDEIRGSLDHDVVLGFQEGIERAHSLDALFDSRGKVGNEIVRHEGNGCPVGQSHPVDPGHRGARFYFQVSRDVPRGGNKINGDVGLRDGEALLAQRFRERSDVLELLRRLEIQDLRASPLPYIEEALLGKHFHCFPDGCPAYLEDSLEVRLGRKKVPDLVVAYFDLAFQGVVNPLIPWDRPLHQSKTSSRKRFIMTS